MWDAIVAGSGIGGLAAAAALAKRGRRILVLEQHFVAGGLTQTFKRKEWTFAPGVHYIGGVGPEPGGGGQFGRLLSWLSNDALRFEASVNPYDIIELPGFVFGIPHPESAYRDALHERFPQQHAAIAAWFKACDAARRQAFTLFAQRSMPRWLGWGMRLWRGAAGERLAQRTVADELARIDDALLRAVLGARGANYGALPAQAPFVEHALVTGAYNGGSYYPVGGPGRFAQTLVPVIESAGGEVLLGADVKHIVINDGRVCGVEFERHGERRQEQSRYVISDMGVANTVACLDPTAAAAWQQSIRALSPGMVCVSLFIGMDGDIEAAGASSANHWIYESQEIGALWRDPVNQDAPGIFVSFPSLKESSGRSHPIAEVVAALDPTVFARWITLPDKERPDDYRSMKVLVEKRLLAQFLRHFPVLAPMVRYHELSTPLTQRRYVRTPNGSMYGFAMAGDRLTNPALHLRTPVPGLLLAGQDVMGPGVPAAFMAGLSAAATVDPSLWAKVRS